MNTRYPDFKQQETCLYDEIRELSEGLDRLYKEGKDTTDTIRKLEEVCEEFLLFRQQERPGEELFDFNYWTKKLIDTSNKIV